MARLQLALLALAACIACTHAQVPAWTPPPRTFWAYGNFTPARGAMTNGTGFTRLWANATHGRIDVIMRGTLTGITMSHIHYATGIRRNLVPFAGGQLNPTMNYVGGTNWFTVLFDSSNTNITALKAEIKGNTSYVNIHTVKYGGGEIQAYLKCRAWC